MRLPKPVPPPVTSATVTSKMPRVNMVLFAGAVRRMQILKDDRRLKLLAELRSVVTMISQLAQQLAWNGVASAALAARTGAVCSTLDQDVLRDISFFRHEKQRLKQEMAGLDGPVMYNTYY
ncbi:unnamed protein product [Peronospora belbahrii]|uniref:Uncharacterized protein n=1 Tax=Peronospora belbahrii TaxID=622444 RepID=A0AAU9KZE0_9STRA|nr:unnamed protein product [Peronospora belbahrii]